ncbi:MAG: hypothetical protein ACK4WF_09480, partial [Candidatus Brocadiales bacterium]
MRILRRIYFCVFVVSLFPLPFIYADANEEHLLSEIQLLREEYESRLNRLEEELKELRLEREEAIKVKPTPAEKRELLPKKVVSLGDSELEFYGFLRTDTIYDDSKADRAQTPFFIRSEDPRTSRPIGARKNDEQLSLHPRLTRFGMHLHGSEVPLLADAKLDGRLEIDFQNGGSESRQILRLRHGYLKLTKEDWHLLAGQTSDIISPLWPSANNDTLMWNAGNTGDRRPQIHLAYEPKLGLGLLSLVGGIGLTGAVSSKNLDASTMDDIRDGEDSGKPNVQFRVGYSSPLWVKGQNASLGLWTFHGWEEPVTKFAGHRKFHSRIYGLDFVLPMLPTLLAKGEAWFGQDLDDVRGGIGQGINTSLGREVDSQGG